jgi:hypothetical protein
MLINKKKRIRETCRAKEKKTVTSILWLFKLKRVHKFQSTIIQSQRGIDISSFSDQKKQYYKHMI